MHPLHLFHWSDSLRLKFFMTLTRGGSPNIQILVAMSLIRAPLLGKAVGDSTNLDLWREPYQDLTFLVIPVRHHFMALSWYPRVEDTSYNSGEMLVYPDPIMSQIAQSIRGLYREGGAHCTHQAVNCIRQMCHPL